MVCRVIDHNKLTQEIDVDNGSTLFAWHLALDTEEPPLLPIIQFREFLFGWQHLILFLDQSYTPNL